MRTLFLQAPSFDGFDGGAGSRYQSKREIRSFWYPTWLAQPAALVPDSKLIDAPPHGISLAEVVAEAKNFDLAVLHTSTPSFASDVRAIAALKAANPALKAGLIGAKAAVDAEGCLKSARIVDFAARNEFDFTIKEIADGKDWKSIRGLSFRDQNGEIQHTPDRTVLENMDALPFVTPVYKRDLQISRYFIGYLRHPYISIYTGRGCKSRCTFCLWPQSVGGHRYRTRSVGHVIEEIAWAKKAFPEVKEFFFDDDTFTDDLPRAEAIARELGKLGVVWSCNAKANVPRASLKAMRDGGLRLLLVGYETGNQQILYNIKKGMRIDVAKRFTKDCRDLGIVIHGTFIMGLPGETQETIRETIAFAKEVNPHTLQVSLAAPYPGTYLYKQALENGWLDDANAELVDENGVQTTDQPISIFDSASKTGWIYSYYLQDEWKIVPTVTVNFGARYDQFAEFVSERQLSPRVNVVWQPSDMTTFKAGYSRYFTPPPFELIASPTISLFANTTAAPAVTLDSTPKAERAHYFDVGATQIILPGLKAGVDAYYKIASDLIDEGQFGAPVFFTPFNYQKGLVKGIELTLSYELDNWSFYGNFSAGQELAKNIISGQFNFSADDLAFITNSYIHTDHDQTYTSSAGIKYTLPPYNTRFAVDLTAGSGLRTTNPGGSPNGAALPGYQQVNFSIVQPIATGFLKGMELRFDVINLFDEVYQIRSGTGLGVFAPQFGPRRTFLAGLTQRF